MEAQQILDKFREEVQAGRLLTMEQLKPCDDFFTAVDEKGNLIGGGDLDPQDPKTWGFVMYKIGFCQRPGEPFVRRVGNFLQIQMRGKFLAYNPFATSGTESVFQLVGFTLKPGVSLVRIGKCGE